MDIQKIIIFDTDTDMYIVNIDFVEPCHNNNNKTLEII